MTDTQQLIFPKTTPKTEVLAKVKQYLSDIGFTITQTDEQKPWGAYYYVDEKDKSKFAERFFPDQDLSDILDSDLKLTPKILIVAPNELLSWQWHERRGELWNLVAGEANYKMNATDEEPNETYELVQGETLRLPQGTRHRLVGSIKPDAQWGIVAEIWSHTDPSNPSNEEDNHRLKDKYSRT